MVKTFFLFVFSAVFICPVYAQQEPIIRVTKNGSIFKRYDEKPSLGEAWEDPNGLVWGDIASYSPNTPKTFNFSGARRYCSSIGARLPSINEFDSLRKFMGYGVFPGYEPQILPNLDITWSTWSSTQKDYLTAFEFEGMDGSIGTDYLDSDKFARCVIEPNLK
jgi:hypothetical protein